jgi:hypothetical protein
VSEVRRATGQSGDLAFSLELLAELVVVQGEALELGDGELVMLGQFPLVLAEPGVVVV